MNIREFSRHIGVSHPAVLKACKTGRLRRSLTRDSNGRVTGIDPVLGVEEWKAKTRLSPAERRAPCAVPGSNPAPSLELGGVDPLEPSRAFIGVRFPLGSFLAGAAAALRDSGKEASPAALRAVVEGMDEEGWWVAVTAALNAALDPDVPAEQLPAMWEAEGRDAVAGAEDAAG